MNVDYIRQPGLERCCICQVPTDYPEELCSKHKACFARYVTLLLLSSRCVK